MDKNISFLFADYLIPTLKNSINDSEIVKNLHLKRYHVTKIVGEVIAPVWRNRLRKILTSQRFSIIIDESTDITVEKSLCVEVRYFDNELGKITERLWDLVAVYEDEHSRCDAEQTAERILNSLEGLPLQNVVAYCSDTVNVMMGSKNSVATILKEAIPHLVIVKCACHIENLCALHAMASIPPKFRQFIHNVHTYMNSKSSQRLNRWYTLQQNAHLDPIHILKPGFTRWLSFVDSLRSMLRRYNLLVLFIEKEYAMKKKGDSDTIDALHEAIHDPLTELYVKFLYEVLSKFTSVNARMQSISPQFSAAELSPLAQLYYDTLSLYMNQTYLMSTQLR